MFLYSKHYNLQRWRFYVSIPCRGFILIYLIQQCLLFSSRYSSFHPLSGFYSYILNIASVCGCNCFCFHPLSGFYSYILTSQVKTLTSLRFHPLSGFYSYIRKLKTLFKEDYYGFHPLSGFYSYIRILDKEKQVIQFGFSSPAGVFFLHSYPL